MKKLILLGILTAFLSAAVSADLNLEEANVMDVEKDGDRFSVTLYHDDGGEQGYANWWQVETLDGERLGRRTLLHSHGTRNFTRSESIEIPEDFSRIVIRGHDQTHGYGGRAIILNLETGDRRIVDQGTDPEDFSDRKPDKEPSSSENRSQSSSDSGGNGTGEQDKREDQPDGNREDESGSNNLLESVLNLLTSLF